MTRHKIVFHLSHFSIRGSEIAIYDYARYNEELLGNTSLIAVNYNYRTRKDYRGVEIHDEEIYKKFSSRFRVLEYTSKENLSRLMKDEEVTIFYNLKSGENDEFLIDGVKNICHCVFTHTKEHNHGDIYIPISPSIVDKTVRDIVPYVPHIVYPLPPTKENLRSFLKIPSDAIVFGRYGGQETFNIPFVKESIVEISKSNPKIFFIFVNTQIFAQQPNIIFMEKISNPSDKSIFINTCDAMIHGRKEGESFGLSIAEFSMAKKPIITWKHNRTHKEIERDFNMVMDVEHTHHIDILGDSGLYYDDKNSFIETIKNFKKKGGIDKYSEIYSPSKVMSLFEKHIINQSYSRFVESTIFDGKIYVHFSNDDLAKTLKVNGWEPHVYNIIKSLVKSNDTFIDIGSNIGYHTIKVSSLLTNGKVISIEPYKPIFEILQHNIAINNIKNVICVQTGLFSKNTSMFIPELSRYTTNFGDIRMSQTPLLNTIEVSCTNLDYILENQNINIGVIKIDVSGNEIEVIKGGFKSIMKYRPYILLPLESKMFKSNSCFSIKHLMTVMEYSMIEIDSNYPCDHLCYPNEKNQTIREIFSHRIIDNTTNTINNNRSLGITTKIIFEKESTIPIRVKLMCSWTTGEDLCKCWEKMSKCKGDWNNIRVVYDDTNIDYYVIINKPRLEDKYIPAKTMVFRMEPDTSTSSRWNDWYKNKNDFLYFFDLEKYRNNSEWHLGLNYKELRENIITKSKIISSVISSLYQMDGHKKRVDFVKYCQSRCLEIDVYGRDNLHELKTHKGELPYHNKNDGILPYRYTFIAENCQIENYFTEKLIDAILGECLCFYWGCPNIDSFIDPRAYIVLDLNDMEKSYDTVCAAINNNEWMKRLPFIMKEKMKIINHYSFFPRIEGYIKISNLDCKVINLERRKDRWEEFVKKAENERFYRYNKFSAVDGNNLVVTSIIESLFKNFNHRRPKKGEVGCALSHLSIWSNIKNDTLVLEDDITFCKGFHDRLALEYRNLKESYPSFDILYIGYHTNKDVKQREVYTDKFIETFEEVMIDSATNQHMFGRHGGGTFGYIISPEGAKKLMNNLSEQGFLFPVDYQMLLVSKIWHMETYCCTKPLVRSEMYEQNRVDTDIQKTDIL